MLNTNPSGDGRLLTVKQAAARLCCSQANLYTLIERGDLPVVAVGRRKGYRLDVADLDAFVAGRKVCYDAQLPTATERQKTLRHLQL